MLKFISFLVDILDIDISLLYNWCIMKTKLKALQKTCLRCGTTHTIIVPREDYLSWKRGEGLIQDLLSYLDPGTRELLISSFCGDCFDEMFPSQENDEEE